ncbi:MAG: hypothetical protein DMG06_27690 [Acidobacteria bacterium]|nr:MAG: hypothetical protein DMG06_27690 [Acidobacteriota bacterium]
MQAVQLIRPRLAYPLPQGREFLLVSASGACVKAAGHQSAVQPAHCYVNVKVFFKSQPKFFRDPGTFAFVFLFSFI